jgi:hypothetical protein
MRKKADELFGKTQSFSNEIALLNFLDWLYDCNIVHTPTTISHSSQHRSIDFTVEDRVSPQENSNKSIMQNAVKETGFEERTWMTSSFTSMQAQSQTNFLRMMEKIFNHVAKIFAPNDHSVVRSALVERSIKKMRKDFDTELG